MLDVYVQLVTMVKDVVSSPVPLLYIYLCIRLQHVSDSGQVLDASVHLVSKVKDVAIVLPVTMGTHVVSTHGPL